MSKRIDKWNIAAALMVAVMVLLSVLSLHNLLQINERLKTMDTFVTIAATGEKNAESEGTEVWLTGLAPDGFSVDLAQYVTDEWQLQGDALMSVKGVVTMEFKEFKKLRVSFIAHAWSGIVEITTPAGTERYDLYRADNGGTQYFEIDIPYMQKD